MIQVVGAELGVRPEMLHEWLKRMLLIRYFETQVDDFIQRGIIYGSAHLYIGQEAVATGVCAALEPLDYIVSTHRGHGHCIAKGADVNRMMAELLGKATGYSYGKGGSMHIADVETGNLGATGIVGAGVPIAAGAALTSRLKNLGRVAVSFFGDGAANQGAFHEGVNLAAVWDLPAIFVCENNQYAMSTAFSKSFKIRSVADRAPAYGIPGISVDGNDILAVYAAAREAVERARAGGGPTLIEARTYRWKGHSRVDTERYRTRDEVKEWRERCPIRRLRDAMLADGLLDEATYARYEAEARAAIQAAVQFAQESPEPALDTLTRDVYADA